METIDNRIADFMRDLPFFSGLPEADMAAFLDSTHSRRHEKGSTIFYQGDQAQFFFVIISGWVKLYRNTPEGEESLIGLFTRGDTLGESALFTGSTYTLSAEAARDTHILVIPGAVMKSRAQNNPDITIRMLMSLSREIRNLQRQNEQMAIMSAPQRVSCLLLQLSSHMLGNGGTLTFPYDKSLAAIHLGMKPATFSRALAQLKPLGVTIKGPEVKIESFARLGEYSCSQRPSFPANAMDAV